MNFRGRGRGRGGCGNGDMEVLSFLKVQTVLMTTKEVLRGNFSTKLLLASFQGPTFDLQPLLIDDISLIAETNCTLAIFLLLKNT